MSEKAVLYVDDEPMNLRLFEINFSDMFKIYTAQDGCQGLDTLQREKVISTVISDMRMPGMNGIEFITKAKDSFPDKKYLLLTGFENIPGTIPEIDSALQAGLISKCLRKPFQVSEIEELIE